MSAAAPPHARILDELCRLADARRFAMPNAPMHAPGPGLAAVALCLALVPAAALGQVGGPAHDRARIVYSAPPGCPDERAFLASVRTKTQSEWFASPGELARTITVTIRARADQSVASLVLIDAQGRSVSRKVSAETCEAAADAIAIVTAIAIESQTLPAVGNPAGEGPVVAKTVGQAAATEGAATRPRSLTSHRWQSSPPQSSPSRSTQLAAPRTVQCDRDAQSPRRNFRAELGVQGGALANALPGVAWGAALFSGQYWPALDSRTRIALRYWDTGRLAEYDAEVQFSLMAARVSLCPMQRWLGSSVSLHACAAAEAGLLSARGFVAPPSVVAKDSARVLWAALGLEAWLRVASGQVFGELGLQADAPLAHREFSFKRPERTVHTIPWTGGSITVGAGMAFP